METIEIQLEFKVLLLLFNIVSYELDSDSSLKSFEKDTQIPILSRRSCSVENQFFEVKLRTDFSNLQLI